MNSATSNTTEKSPAAQGELVRRYRRIGISAVAGALEYGNSAKKTKSAPAPVERRIKERELQVSA